MSSSYSFYKVSKIEGDVPMVITVGSSYLEEIENDEEYPVSMYEYEALYALYKAALLASKGNKIWCEVS